MEKKIIEDLKKIVLNWYFAYLNAGLDEGFDTSFILKEEIEEFVIPYLDFQTRAGFISRADADEFYSWCMEKVQELSRILKKDD